MSKLAYSFIIAILLHIIVLVLSTYIKGIENQDAFVTRNLIDVQFGSSGFVKSASSAQPVKKTLTKKAAPLVVTTGTEKNSSAGTTVGSSSGNGNENTGRSFESTIVSYEGPAYPRQAQLRGLEGVVRVRVEVSVEGLPQSTRIIQSSGHEILDRAATSVIPRWRFQKSSSSYAVEKNIVFKLKG